MDEQCRELLFLFLVRLVTVLDQCHLLLILDVFYL